MGRHAVVVAVLASCFEPKPPAEVPCPTGECPSGQTCSVGVCVPIGGEIDPDGPEPEFDAPVDTQVDAAPDARIAVAPMLRGFSTVLGNATTTMISSPSGTQPGDLLLAHATDDGPTESTTMATPAGWARLVESNAVQDRFIVVVFFRYAGATSEDFTFEFPNASNAVNLMAFSGVNPSTPIDVAAIGALDDTVEPTAPSVTTTQPKTTLVTLYSMDLSTSAFEPVPGMTEIFDADANGLRNAGSITEVDLSGPTGDKIAQRTTASDIGPTINATVAIAPE